tara:strand:- start:53099 stop:53365 length:267 start_codon:yes stop_codon:yes gene_type:complete
MNPLQDFYKMSKDQQFLWFQQHRCASYTGKRFTIHFNGYDALDIHATEVLEILDRDKHTWSKVLASKDRTVKIRLSNGLLVRVYVDTV